MAAMTPSTLRIGYRYRPKRLAPEYDAVVIGSGMGGLTTAALLSALGWKVCVLEQHYTAGGFTHSFERNGYEWDVGVHYIGEVGAQTRSRRMFDFLSDGKLEWAPMDTEFDRFYVGNKVFNARAGKQEFRDNLLKQFPKEQQAIDNYMKLLTSSGGALSAFGMGRAMKPWLQSLAQPFLNWKTPNVFFRNTYDVLSELTDDQELIAVLCGQWGDMGLPPKQSTFLAHAMIARHYLYGGYYPNSREHHPENPESRWRSIHLREGQADSCRERASPWRRDERRTSYRLHLCYLVSRNRQYVQSPAAGRRCQTMQLQEKAGARPAQLRAPRRLHRSGRNCGGAWLAENQLLDLPEQRLRRRRRSISGG
jgi:hypothetical protein